MLIKYLLKKLGYVKENDQPSKQTISITEYLQVDTLKHKIKCLEKDLEIADIALKCNKRYIEQVKVYITRYGGVTIDCVGEPSIRYLVERLVEQRKSPTKVEINKEMPTLDYKYLVLKWLYINKYLDNDDRVRFGKIVARIEESIYRDNHKLTRYIVIGEDWPEYKDASMKLRTRINRERKESRNKC